MIYFVSGHLDLTKAEFEEHYEPRLQQMIDEGSAFVVGDAPGCDSMAIDLIAPRSQKLTIFHMFEAPRHKGEMATYVGHFVSDEDRDAALTRASHADIAWVRPSKAGKCGGTERNLLRRDGVLIDTEPTSDRVHPVLAWRNRARSYERQLENANQVNARLQGEDVRLREAMDTLAQAGLNLVVGFQLVCEGNTIYFGGRYGSLVAKDLEVAQSIEHIVAVARARGCQGLTLLPESDKTDGIEGIFSQRCESRHTLGNE